jgi:hypothetical protein
MISVIRGSLFCVFFYCEKSEMGSLGRYSQNHHFIVVIEIQDWLSLSPESYQNWFLGKSNRLIASLYTTDIIQIRIVFRHTEIPCLRPAVSSLGACPTPTP